MKICILFLFSLLQVAASAQAQKEVDRLLHTTDSLLKKHHYIRARQIANLALDRANQVPINQKGRADSYMRIGLTFKGEEEFEEALINYKQALNIRRNILQDTIAVARALTSMSSAGVGIDLDQALKDAQEAESIYLAQRSLVTDSLRAMLYNNMAIIYKEMDSLENAVEAAKKSLALFPFSRDTLNRIKTEYTLSQNLIEQEKYEEAKLHIDTAMFFDQRMGQPDSLLLGKIYEARGIVELRKYPDDPDKAIVYFEQAKAVFLRFPDAKANLTNVYFNLGEAYENKGDLDQANTYYQLAEGSVNKKDKKAQVSLPQMIESRIETTDVNIKKQRLEMWLTIALVSLLVALLIIALSVARGNRILYLKAKEATLASDRLYLKEKENGTLKEEMIMLRHDIVKNFLQIIENQIAEHKPENTNKTFNEIKYLISRLFVQIGYGGTVEESSTTLRKFVTDMQLWAGVVARMPVINDTFWSDLPDLPISAALREELEAIVTETFTNIRKYAFDADTQPKIVSLRFEYLYDQGLIITIQDQGKGFESAGVERSGLHNLEVRAERIKGKLTIKSAEGEGTLVRLVLPNFPDVQ